MLCAMVPLPSFNEVPGTLSGSEGLLLDGFRAEVLANFRLYSLMNEALMWSFIGVTWVCLAALPRLSANQPVAAERANSDCPHDSWTPPTTDQQTQSPLIRPE